MDLKQISAFVWVAELGGFRAAAEKLHTTQPTISQRIAGLEASLGTRLFERSARGIGLTQKGQELLPLAQRMVHTGADILRIARAESAMQGTLRLGSTETLVHTWLDHLIDILHRRYPALTLDLQVDITHVLRGQLAARQIDLALVVGPSQDVREHSLHLCDYDLAWIASPGMKLHDRPITVAELGQFPVITYPSVSVPYQAIKTLLLQAGVKSPRLYGSASLSTIVHMTQRGIGSSVIAPVVVAQEIDEGRLCLLNADQTPEPLGFYACWVDGANSYVPQTVAALAQEVARKHGLKRKGHKQ
ncbi:MAG TPA: LysR family transcriptional regulator [Castellaniella sp.]|uniref:LysR family transcriptional regulator n=1 Tax=Castellaniella sp. TaxID=1955812 RepID=UPI002EFC8C9C